MDLLAFAEVELETNRLEILLKSYLRPKNKEEKFMLLSNFKGDFSTNATLNWIHKRIFSLKTATLWYLPRPSTA